MIINKKALTNAVIRAAHTNSVTVYSEKASRVLRYSNHVINGYRKGIFAADVMEDAIETVYPVLWQEVCKIIPSTRREREQCPTCGGWYLPAHPTGVKMKHTAPALKEIDREIMTLVEDELKTPSGRSVSIYSARAAVVLRYLSYTKEIPSMSREGGDLLEIGLEEIYPEFF